MKKRQGNLIELAKEGTFDVIVHGCNCWCEMGAGIAKAIRQSFPEAYEADRQTTPGDRSKLGTCTTAASQVGDHTVHVVNAYTQFNYTKQGDEVLVDYDAVRSCMRWIKERFSGLRIGLPKIGAGLAGGDWGEISRIIDEELAEEDVTLVEL
jgi:O-acetyl-ADP-ribose deacetylase (regulator of RNase III)